MSAPAEPPEPAPPVCTPRRPATAQPPISLRNPPPPSPGSTLSCGLLLFFQLSFGGYLLYILGAGAWSLLTGP